jgi:hypothetical protein
LKVYLPDIALYLRAQVFQFRLALRQGRGGLLDIALNPATPPDGKLRLPSNENVP